MLLSFSRNLHRIHSQVCSFLLEKGLINLHNKVAMLDCCLEELPFKQLDHKITLLAHLSKRKQKTSTNHELNNRETNSFSQVKKKTEEDEEKILFFGFKT